MTKVYRSYRVNQNGKYREKCVQGGEEQPLMVDKTLRFQLLSKERKNSLTFLENALFIGCIRSHYEFIQSKLIRQSS